MVKVNECDALQHNNNQLDHTLISCITWTYAVTLTAMECVFCSACETIYQRSSSLGFICCFENCEFSIYRDSTFSYLYIANETQSLEKSNVCRNQRDFSNWMEVTAISPNIEQNDYFTGYILQHLTRNGNSHSVMTQICAHWIRIFCHFSSLCIAFCP